MTDTLLLWKVAGSGTPLPVLQSIDLNVIFTTGLLDILAVIFLLFGLLLFVFYLRKGSASQTSANGHTVPKRPVGVLSLAVLILPLLGLLLVWSNIPNPNPPPLTPTVIIPSPTPTPKPPVNPPSDLLSPGFLTVGVYTAYPPQDSTANGQAVGFDIDFAQALAKEMGLKLKLQMDQFSNLLPNLQSQKVDVVIAGMSITSDVQQQADFIPYLKSVETLMIPKANSHNVKHLTDLCGLTVGVIGGTPAVNDLNVAEANCKKNKSSDITIMSQIDAAGTVQLLQKSKIDVAYLDVPIVNYYMHMHQYQGQFITGDTMTESVNQGIAVRQGDASMLQQVGLAFDAMRRDKTYTNLLKSNGWDFTSESL